MRLKDCSRRDALRILGAFSAGALLLLPRAGARAQITAQTRFETYPFSLGVASGYPTPNAAVLWTRLAPLPLAPAGGMEPRPVAVRWEVSTDPGFSKIVSQGEEFALPEWAHSVHPEVNGLAPARQYWYRFHAGEATSPVGRFRTAPGANSRGGRLRLALGSCQNYEHGYFTAHRHIAQDDPDLVIWAGDYIYESSWGSNLVRRHEAAEAITLDDYRRRYAIYKSDLDLQLAHAAAPWAVSWDDHEVANDYAGDRSESGDDPAWFLERRAGAYKAWYEHMPVPRRMLPFGPNARIHARLGWGGLASLNLLDDRQYRSQQVCPRPGRRGGNVVDIATCPELLEPRRSMLGAQQLEWLKAGLTSSRSRWNIIAQHSVMAQVDRRAGPGREAWTDSWDGYPMERRAILEHLAGAKTSNPVVVGGDVHMFYVTDLKTDFDDPKSPIVASEFVGTSISSQGGSQENVDRILPDNPHIKLGHTPLRGYTRFDITPERMRVDLRAMETVKERDSACNTFASFVVEHGRPGPQRA